MKRFLYCEVVEVTHIQMPLDGVYFAVDPIGTQHRMTKAGIEYALEFVREQQERSLSRRRHDYRDYVLPRKLFLRVGEHVIAECGPRF